MSGNKDKEKQGAQKISTTKAGKSAKSVSFTGRSDSTGVAASVNGSAQPGSSRASGVQGVNSNKGRVMAAAVVHPPPPPGQPAQERRPVVPAHSASASVPSGSGSSVVRKEVSSSETDSFDDSATGPLHILDLPESVLENVFTFLSLKDIPTAAMVCRQWSDIIMDENSEVWRSSCARELNSEVMHSELLACLPTFKSKLRAFHHAWNPHDCSRNIFVKTNGFTIHRNPVAQSTDGVRGKIGFSEGRHAWEVIWEGPLGTVAVVGVASRRADMRAQGYIALLGQDEHSWGWNLVDNSLLHNGDSQGHYPLINNAPRYQVGERIRVILDCEDSTLAFEKDYEFLGVAFRGLPTHELLYPSISAVYGNTEVSMVYLGPPLDG